MRKHTVLLICLLLASLLALTQNSQLLVAQQTSPAPAASKTPAQAPAGPQAPQSK